MSWDIHGNPLRRGHCEVHPNVHEEYPCSTCLMDRKYRESPADKLAETEHCLGQAQEHIKEIESQLAALKEENERLKEKLSVSVVVEESFEARIKWAHDQLNAIRCERKDLYEIISKIEARNTELLTEIEARAGKAASDIHCLELLNSALKARVAELEGNAARYEWLRNQHWNDGKLCVVVAPKISVKLGSLCPSLDLLDETIDSFIREKEPTNEG